ncbi:MAG: glycoside hydrolase family 3 protein, partial [Saprospiraceae bacterium]|nr:glycoside hydrolase family 3 protein [Saprospiraceae bacterium]
MKKFFRILWRALLVILILLIIFIAFQFFKRVTTANNQLRSLGEPATVLVEEGFEYRDLNKNGSLDVYEDPRADIQDRIDDLLSQMTLEEKAGTMYITMIGMTPKGEPLSKPIFSTNPLHFMMAFFMPTASEMLAIKKMNSFNTLNAYDTRTMATFNNNLQKLAERSRLGIPVTLATDPRHITANNPGAAIYTPAFSKWPSHLGLAATRDTNLIRQYGDIARQEYVAVGFRLALHPSADLATEPRWGRVYDTFGEDAKLSARMTRNYIRGFQGDSLGAHSVANMTKHFSGGGPQKDGEDAHFPYGKEQVYPGDNFAYHVIPFSEGALPAGTAQIMPYYGIPVDQTSENVAFGFNKEIITGLLRDSLGFDGVVCADWSIISDSKMGGGRAWGVEELSPLERTQKALDAGLDQFGGESSSELAIELVEKGMIPESRLDESVRRILRDKFRLGLFDNPYVDPDQAAKIVGSTEFRAAGERAQAKASILLKNDNILPLEKGIKIFAEGIVDTSPLESYGSIVKNQEEADVVVMRINSPFEIRNDFFLENFFHQGRLYYSDEELGKILATISNKPSIVVANLERPTILTEINEATQGLIGEFGTSDKVLADILFGERKPEGKLPIELPSSREAVQQQKEDLPYDSKDPLYPFGHGLSYN